jgi:hypothetical protein
MSVCCDCCVLSDRGLCDELITRPEESYRLWCVFACDIEKQYLVNEEAKAHKGAIAPNEKELTTNNKAIKPQRRWRSPCSDYAMG